MIHRLSLSIASWLDKQAPGHSVAVMAYGIEMVLIAVIQLSLILFIAFCFGLFSLAFITLLAFTVLRIVAGGKHLSAFWSCTLTDILLINGLAWLALKSMETPWFIHVPVLGILTIITWMAVHRYAPLITVRRPASRLQTHGRTYSKGVVLVAAAVAAISYLWNPVYSAAIILGMAAQGLSITPMGCKAIDQLDCWLSSYLSFYNGRREVE